MMGNKEHRIYGEIIHKCDFLDELKRNDLLKLDGICSEIDLPVSEEEILEVNCLFPKTYLIDSISKRKIETLTSGKFGEILRTKFRIIKIGGEPYIKEDIMATEEIGEKDRNYPNYLERMEKAGFDL